MSAVFENITHEGPTEWGMAENLMLGWTGIMHLVEPRFLIQTRHSNRLDQPPTFEIVHWFDDPADYDADTIARFFEDGIAFAAPFLNREIETWHALHDPEKAAETRRDFLHDPGMIADYLDISEKLVHQWAAKPDSMDRLTLLALMPWVRNTRHGLGFGLRFGDMPNIIDDQDSFASFTETIPGQPSAGQTPAHEETPGIPKWLMVENEDESCLWVAHLTPPRCLLEYVDTAFDERLELDIWLDCPDPSAEERIEALIPDADIFAGDNIAIYETGGLFIKHPSFLVDTLAIINQDTASLARVLDVPRETVVGWLADPSSMDKRARLAVRTLAQMPLLLQAV